MTHGNTKYKKKFCIELVEAGKTLTPFRRFCTDRGFTKSTGHKWVQDYPEFAAAKEMYDDIMIGLLEDKAFAAATEDEPCNTAMLKMMMASRTKEYRKDVLEGTTNLEAIAKGGTVTINFAEATEENING